MNYIICPKCFNKKIDLSPNCTGCNYSFTQAELLKVELFKLKDDFQNKITLIESKLNQIDLNESKAKQELKIEAKASSPEEKFADEKRELEQNKTNNPTPQTKPVEKAETQNINTEPAKPIIHKPGLIEKLIEYLLEFIFGYFSGLGEFSKKIYSKYKDENKLPIFFMTLSGIIIFLLGFGYLFQYSFNNYFNEIAKVITGFSSSFIILFTAFKLFKKYSEFSSALMALSIILNYITIYFLSSYYGISSSLTGFFLITINAYLSMYLALKYETKTIAALFLYGSALTPFYLDSSSSPLFYYVFLFIILVSAMYVAYKINWKSLIFSSLFLVFGILSLSFFSVDRFTDLINPIKIIVFMFLYITFALTSKFRLKETLDKTDLSILVLSISISSACLFSLVSNLTNLGIIYLLCSSPFLILSLFKKIMPNEKIHFVFFMISSVFVIFAIPALVDIKLIGTFWTIEALFLILCAFLFDLKKLRKNAYSILAFSILSILYTFPFLIINWDFGIKQIAFYNLYAMFIFALILYSILNKFKELLESYEKTLFIVAKEFLPNYLSIILIVIGLQILDIYSFLFIPLIVLALIFWSKRNQLSFTLNFSLAFYALLLIPILVSIQETGSIRFSGQTVYGKLSIVEFISMLWFLDFYLQKLGIDSFLAKAAKTLREIFYLILPIIIIPITRRLDIEYLILTAWISLLLAYFLHLKFRYQSLKIEFYTILFTLSFVIFSANFIEISTHSELFSLEFISLVIGILLSIIYLVLYKFDKKSILDAKFKVLPVYIYYYFAAFIFLLGYQIFSFHLASLLTSIYLLYISRLYKKLAPVRHLYPYNYNYAKLGFFAFLVMSSTSEFNAVNTAFAILFIFEWFRIIKSSRLIHLGIPPKLKNRNASYWRIDQYFFHLMLILFYIKLSLQLDLDAAFLTASLILHAILVLYQSTRSKYEYISRFAYLIFACSFIKLFVSDLDGFDLITKIVVFMLLGALLLGSAYLFQRLKKS